MSNHGFIPGGISPRRSVGNGLNSSGTRSGRRFSTSLYSVVLLHSRLSPPSFAVFRQISPTMSQLSVWYSSSRVVW